MASSTKTTKPSWPRALIFPPGPPPIIGESNLDELKKGTEIWLFWRPLHTTRPMQLTDFEPLAGAVLIDGSVYDLVSITDPKDRARAALYTRAVVKSIDNEGMLNGGADYYTLRTSFGGPHGSLTLVLEARDLRNCYCLAQL